MKIVYVSLSYLPKVAGGVQVLTHSIAKEMQSRGHDVEVLCAESVHDGDGQVRGEHTEYDGMPVERVHLNRYRQPNYFRSFYDVPSMADYLVDSFARRKPDLFHILHFSRLSASVFEGMRRLGVPVLLTLADYAFLCPLGTLMRYNGAICPGAEAVGGLKCLGCFVDETRTYKNSALRHVFNSDEVAVAIDAVDHLAGIRHLLPHVYQGAGRAFKDRIPYFKDLCSQIDLFTTNNHWSREFYIEHGFPPERIRTVVQTLDVSWSAGFTRTPYEGPLRIGFTGAVASHKGVDVLIKAFLRMKRQKNACLLIFGENDSHPFYVKKLLRMIGSNDRVEFKGRYQPTELNRIYNQMDVMVAPSMFYETGPLVVLEAQATKTPAISSDLGPIRELIRHGVDGYLFERGNSEQLASILDRLCEHREEVDRLRSNIRPVKTVAAMADELEALYVELKSKRVA